MVAAIKQTVTIGPGGSVTIPSSQLQAGMRAEVIVLVEPAQTPDPADQPLSAFIGAGKGCYSSVEKVDQFIRNERDEWDR